MMRDSTSSNDLERLRAELRGFVDERGWRHFHDPKNLAMAIAGEAGELVAELQWLTSTEASSLDEDVKRRVIDEAVDVLIYVLHLGEALGVDLVTEALGTVERNRERFPVDEREPE